MFTEGTLHPELTSSLSGDAIDLYCHAVRHGAIESIHSLFGSIGMDSADAQAAVESLLVCRLLRVDQDGRLVPVDPEIAAASLISPMEWEIFRRRDEIVQIRERTDSVLTHYRDTRKAVWEPPVIEQIGGVEIRGLLEIERDACSTELLIANPNTDSASMLDNVLPMCLSLLGKGVTVRVLCQHGARADLPVRAKLKRFTDAGATVRTVSCLPRAAVIYDQSSAVLFTPQDRTELSGARVLHDDVVSFILDVFNQIWDAATPYDTSFDSGYCEVAGDMQQAIAQLMVQGFTDEVVARRLGMSIRACRRHIAALLRNLDASSRFQAGAQAARRNLI